MKSNWKSFIYAGIALVIIGYLKSQSYVLMITGVALLIIGYIQKRRNTK
jgi:hypothetical protein